MLELLLVVNVKNILFSDISAKYFDHQENKQKKNIRLKFQIYQQKKYESEVETLSEKRQNC